MSEAIIARGSTTKEISADIANNTFITSNQYYTVEKSGNYFIELVGGGGGGWRYAGRAHTNSMTNSWVFWSNVQSWAGGGSGFINNDTIFLNKGEEVYVTIGRYGNAGSSNSNKPTSGGITSFGEYLSANGGGWSNANVIGNARGANPGRYYWVSRYWWDNNGEIIEINNTNGGKQYSSYAGILYYNETNNRMVSTVGSNRLYYGDGGGAPGNGNNGCCIITYID